MDILLLKSLKLKNKLILMTLCFFAIYSPVSLAEFRYPPANDLYVNDYANLIDSSNEFNLRTKLENVKSEHGIEFTVITIINLSDYHAGPEIELFATNLFNHWGVGNAEKNNGIMVLVAKNDRKMRIEIGKGYESYWDVRMKQIIENTFIPYFKNDNYQAGIINGVTDIINTVTAPSSSNKPYTTDDAHTSLWQIIKEWWFLVVIPAFISLAITVRNYLRKRPRSCHRCHYQMSLLSENADDKYLDPGQKMEEFLDSVDYYVWWCRQCKHTEIFRYKSWFSGIGACPSCQYITLDSEEYIIHQATTSSSGLKEIHYRCEQCGFTDMERKTIPPKTESKNSSFGGGSSSGGGASGSW